jgi:hypothetical protein
LGFIWRKRIGFLEPWKQQLLQISITEATDDCRERVKTILGCMKSVDMLKRVGIQNNGVA